MKINQQLEFRNSVIIMPASSSMESSQTQPNIPTILSLSSTIFFSRIELPKRGRCSMLLLKTTENNSKYSMTISPASSTCTKEHPPTTKSPEKFHKNIKNIPFSPGANCSAMSTTPSTRHKRKTVSKAPRQKKLHFRQQS